MIWSNDQLNQAERIWHRVEVEEPDWQAPGGEESTKASMAAAMVEAAHSIGVELQADHMLYGTGGLDEERNVRMITVRWHPMIDQVELLGGRADGEVITWTRWPEPFIVAAPAESDEPAVMYERDGWNESENRWVYRPAASTSSEGPRP